MIFDIVTLVPEMFAGAFTTSILGSACRDGLITVNLHNFREQATDRHHTVDDTPYGGGPGMVLRPPPLATRLQQLRALSPLGPVIFLTPHGVPLRHEVVRGLARFPRLTLVAGRYEGFDDRLLSQADLELSVGDYVLTGGEFAAMVVVDAVARMVPGVVGTAASVVEDSFFGGRLDHPQYTRPQTWQDRDIPAVLRGGNHRDILTWRTARAMVRTAVRRPDLLRRRTTDSEERACLQHALRPANAAGTTQAKP